MVARIILSIVVGIVTSFLFWLFGTLIAPITPQIGGILIDVSYWAGVIAAIVWFFYGDRYNVPPRV